MRTSPYEGDGEIEQERADEIDRIKSSGDGHDEGQRRAAELPNRSLRVTERLKDVLTS
jgi:hypothetical protein